MPQLSKQNPSLVQFLSRFPVAKPSKNFIQNIFLSELHPTVLLGALIILLLWIFLKKD